MSASHPIVPEIVTTARLFPKLERFSPEVLVYRELLSALTTYAGYREGSWDHPAAGDDTDTFYVFAYDWRRDNVDLMVRQLRDLVRCREDIRAELMRARHRIGGFLLRREIYWEGPGEAWSRKHRSWLTSVRFADRASQATLADCTKLLHQLTNKRPEVAVDIEVYTISPNLMRATSMRVTDTFNFYNIPAIALVGLGGQSITSLVNQLISSGGINQAGGSALSGLLAQLQGQSNSIFSQPLATFGNGLTFSGVSLDHLTTALSLNESWSRSLSHVTLRAEQGSDATFHLGERYPILNASYAPIYNSPQISAVLGNQSYVPPFPSVSYEDLGLSLKTKPVINGDGEVSMTLELQVRSLTGQSANGVPVIANQEYKGSIRLRDGEPAVVAGEITTNDQRSIAGIPAVADIPGINQVFTDNTRMKEYDELLIMLTPHVVANHGLATDEIWVSEK